MLSHEIRIREIIEDSGKIFEKFGLTPMQGRIAACLAISDPPEKSFDELVKYFMASKSSVSNSLNYLLQNKLIDYKTFASNRKRYFYITDSFLKVYFNTVLENVTLLREFAYRTVSMRSPEYPEASAKLLRWIEDGNLFQKSVGDTLDSINN